MSNSLSNHWNTLLTSSKVNEHCVYNLTELHKIPHVPGIYGWYLVMDNINFGEYYKIFKQKRVKVDIEGELQERYLGNAQATFDENNFPSTGVDFDLGGIASFAFSPPLYIGISKKLGNRLKDHTNELLDVYYKRPMPSPLPLGKTEFDTIYESKHFASRIGYTLKNHTTVGLTSFRIKTLEMPSGYTWQDLQRVERYVNRTYIPVYGRK
jgi:hypothetical protein